MDIREFTTLPKPCDTGRGLCFECGRQADLVLHPVGWLCEDCEANLDCNMCGEAHSYGHVCPENSN